MVDNLINCNDLGHSEHNKYMFTLWTTDLEHLKITLLFSLCLGFTDINYFAYIDIKFMCMPLGLFWFSYLCCFVWILIVMTGHKKGPFEFSWTKKQTFFFSKNLDSSQSLSESFEKMQTFKLLEAMEEPFRNPKGKTRKQRHASFIKPLH